MILFGELVATLTDEALRRINCYGIGAWLEATVSALGQTLPGSGMAPGTSHATVQASGLILTLGRVALARSDPRDSFVLSRVEGDASAPMPCGLDPTIDTIVSAEAKLSRSTAGGSSREIASGDRRVSFFMDGARVVELNFASSMTGFNRIILARLGTPLDWHDAINR